MAHLKIDVVPIADGMARKKRAGNTTALIYESLRADISSGKLAPGTPLSQLKIAKAAGTSRGPIREAMRRLQQDQLVIAKENHRFNVAPFDLADMEVVLSLHLVNVTFAIHVSVPFLTDGEIEHLWRCVKILNENPNIDELGWQKAYRDFIITIIKHAGARVVSVVEGLVDNIERYRRGLLANLPMVSPSPRGLIFQQILEAATVRDGKLAAERFREFSSSISTLILAGADPQYDGFRLRAYVSAMANFKGSYTSEK